MPIIYAELTQKIQESLSWIKVCGPLTTPHDVWNRAGSMNKVQVWHNVQVLFWIFTEILNPFISCGTAFSPLMHFEPLQKRMSVAWGEEIEEHTSSAEVNWKKKKKKYNSLFPPKYIQKYHKITLFHVFFKALLWSSHSFNTIICIYFNVSQVFKFKIIFVWLQLGLS